MKNQGIFFPQFKKMTLGESLTIQMIFRDDFQPGKGIRAF
jgi:hypothetical protein